ncbi:hypothetical protein [Natrinema amylolyticum]|uniref:hypothetical protein n=1 Tax=Natrinema amylolyticum TaxID=2878679 RepID=UPI001CFC3C9D|nr:hypothetical protein [Natrinema amylolyticum]
MQKQTILAIAVAATLLVGATGAATAQPADGPPNDLPDPVPEFVGDILETITEFVSGAVESLGEVVRSLIPGGDAAGSNDATE